MKLSKSASYVGFRVNLEGFDIRPIDTHHETSDELSRSSGVNDDVLRCPPTGAYTLFPPRGVKPSKSAPHMGFRLNLGGFDIRPIDKYHETSDELSTSSGDSEIATRSSLLGHERCPPNGSRNRRN